VAQIRRYNIGEFTVTPIADGGGPLRFSILQGITEAECLPILERAFGGPGPYHSSVNTFLVERGGDTYLVDNGAGDKYGPALGKLFDNLGAAGYAPGQVSALINTHLHVDHVGGCYKDGVALFPNAEFIVGRTEYDFWTSEANRANAPEARQAAFTLANDAVAAYAERLRIVGDSAEIFPGISAVPLPGHTPGHTGIRIESGGDSLLIWGDIIHSLVQVARPEVCVLFDTDQDQARATRQALLRQVAATRQLIAGMHVPFPGVGTIEPEGERYRFVPA
jgi:glyoxylase-like metal-dependent hydrolase (beta-lactamase superfamily II)